VALALVAAAAGKLLGSADMITLFDAVVAHLTVLHTAPTARSYSLL